MSKISLKTSNKIMIVRSMESKMTLTTQSRMSKMPLKMWPVGSEIKSGILSGSETIWTMPMTLEEMKLATTTTFNRCLGGKISM